MRGAVAVNSKKQAPVASDPAALFQICMAVFPLSFKASGGRSGGVYFPAKGMSILISGERRYKKPQRDSPQNRPGRERRAPSPAGGSRAEKICATVASK